MTKYIKPKTILPADARFYSVPLGNDGFELTLKTLHQHYRAAPKSRKMFIGLKACYIRFERELAQVSVAKPGEKTHLLLIHISIGEMEICCDCGMPGDNLCIHAYSGLCKLMYFQKASCFKNLYWPGVTTEFKRKNKYLDINPHEDQMSIRPKKEFGNLFRPGINFKGLQPTQFEKQPIKQPVINRKKNKLVLGYFLAYNPRSHPGSHLPFILPFVGLSDNQGKNIRKFQQFIKEDVPDTIELTSNQRLLNKISKEMLFLVKAMDKRRDWEEESMLQYKKRIFDLWQQACLPHLCTEDFVYAYYTGHLRMLYGRPAKFDAKECHLTFTSPVLSFRLFDRGDHFSLQAVIMIDDHEVELKARKIPFFITNDTGLVYYPVASVQDDDLLNWMIDNGNRITILKAHFIAFHEQFLKSLAECYPVMYKPGGTKKLISFTFASD
jgi:hypothetical protein